MSAPIRSVALMIHTIDEGVSRVRNVVYDETSIDMFNSISKQQFLLRAMKQAEKFWNQVVAGDLRNR